MLKKVLTTLILSFIVIWISGCHEEQEPSLTCSPDIMETVNESVNEDCIESETETVIIAQEATSSPVEVIQPRATTSQPTNTPEPSPPPTETPKPQTVAQPVSTPKPQQSLTQTATPSSTQQPSESSPIPPESSPVPTPEPMPESIPTPVQAPEPAPKPTPEPQTARTICNTCGADITGNIPEHGTAHMLNDENFSYRVE